MIYYLLNMRKNKMFILKYTVGDGFLKKVFKIMFVAFSVLCAVMLSGCGNDENEVKQSEIKKDYDICIYNSDRDNEEKFREMCDEYTNRTGVIIKTITPSEEDDTIENLESYLNSESAPDIFTVNNTQELKKWKSDGIIWDFSNATDESFKTVANDIPDYLRLSTNTADNFGVPYTVEGIGYVVDPKMISSLFGGDKYRNVIYDLQECSYDEFGLMVEALRSYITSSINFTFTLNGNEYSFVSEKGELSRNLTGVFSFAAGVPKNGGTYMANIPVASVFDSAAATNLATESDVDKLEVPLLRFAEALNLVTQNVAGSSGPMGRGAEMVSTSRNSTAQSLKNFVNGKSLFLLASTEDYEDLSTFNSLVAKRCIFIPIKMPIDPADLRNSESVVTDVNRGITVYSPRYFCMNANSNERQNAQAQKFLTWLCTSDLAAKYVVSEFGYAPYNVEDISVVDNPLTRSVLNYIAENKVVPYCVAGAPEDWGSETLGKYLIEQYFSKAFWSEEDYQNIANYAMEKWKELID